MSASHFSLILISANSLELGLHCSACGRNHQKIRMKVASVLESWELSGHSELGAAGAVWSSLVPAACCGQGGLFLPLGLVQHPRNSLSRSSPALKGCGQTDGRLCPSLLGPAGAKGTGRLVPGVFSRRAASR